MTINLITYIANADLEDLLIETLVSDPDLGIQLEFRALTKKALSDYLESRPDTESRSILIRDCTDDGSKLSSILHNFPNLTLMEVEESEVRDSVEIKQQVSRLLRTLDVAPAKSRKFRLNSELIVITGTSGAPGVTTLAMNLGYEISQKYKTTIIDAHPFRKDVSFLLGGKRVADRVHLSNNLVICNEVEPYEGSINLVDAGPAPDFSSAFTDRRSEARIYLDLLESASQVIYVMAPENNHMYELESFLGVIESGRIMGEPRFLLNQMGSSSRERSIQKRFLARVGSRYAQSLPYDRDSLNRAKAGYSALIDVTPRSKLRGSIRTLASSLFE